MGIPGRSDTCGLTDMNPDASSLPPDVSLVVLCAEWCTQCRAFREVIEGLPATALRWVDIEDEGLDADELGITAFPSVAICRPAGVLRYLAVAHFGRGRGNFVESEAPAFWQDEVEQAVARHDAALLELWKDLRREKSPEQAAERVSPVIAAITSDTLARLYPTVARLV